MEPRAQICTQYLLFDLAQAWQNRLGPILPPHAVCLFYVLTYRAIKYTACRACPMPPDGIASGHPPGACSSTPRWPSARRSAVSSRLAAGPQVTPGDPRRVGSDDSADSRRPPRVTSQRTDTARSCVYDVIARYHDDAFVNSRLQVTIGQRERPAET